MSNTTLPEEAGKTVGSDSLPAGYRQAVVTAIAVVLTFSIAYLRFIALDPASGAWTSWGVACFVLAAVAVVVQLFALWRSLRLADDDAAQYARTVRVFGFGILLIVASLATNMIPEILVIAGGGVAAATP